MEIEIKKVIHSASGFNCDCCTDSAQLVVKIGPVGKIGGTYFDLCLSKDCEEQAFDSYEKGNVDRGN